MITKGQISWDLRIHMDLPSGNFHGAMGNGPFIGDLPIKDGDIW